MIESHAENKITAWFKHSVTPYKPTHLKMKFCFKQHNQGRIQAFRQIFRILFADFSKIWLFCAKRNDKIVPPQLS